MKKEDERVLNLPEPNRELGYSDEELDLFMTKEEKSVFRNWVKVAVITRGVVVFYRRDVKKFLRLPRHARTSGD